MNQYAPLAIWSGGLALTESPSAHVRERTRSPFKERVRLLATTQASHEHWVDGQCPRKIREQRTPRLLCTELVPGRKTFRAVFHQNVCGINSISERGWPSLQPTCSRNVRCPRRLGSVIVRAPNRAGRVEAFGGPCGQGTTCGANRNGNSPREDSSFGATWRLDGRPLKSLVYYAKADG